MKQLLNLFHKIDAFGVPMTFQTPSNKLLYQTALGGIASFAIYTICLIYATYTFIQWGIGEITPKSSTSAYITDYGQINFSQPILSTVAHQLNGDKINPFDPNNIIILPVLYISSSLDQSISIQSLLSSANNTSINNLNLAINLCDEAGQILSNYDYTILFIKCNASLLDPDQKCASDNDIDSYFNGYGNYLEIDLTLQILNGNFEIVQTVLSFYLQIEQTLFQTISLQLFSTLYTLKQNMLTSSTTRTFEAITGAQSSPQTNGIQYGKISYSNLTSYGSVYIVIQPNQSQNIIEKVHIGEVLAEVGSILNILLLIRYLIYELNSRKLWQSVQDEVISYYYPEFQQLKKKHNIFGKLKSVKLYDKTLDLDQFNKFNATLQSKAKQKLTLQNILYEISRLYLILRTNYQQKDFFDSHKLGIRIRLSRCTSDGNNQLDRSCAEEDINQCQYQLNDDDFDAICKSQQQESNLRQLITNSPRPLFHNQSSLMQPT